MPIRDIRRKRVRELVEGRYGGNQTAFANAIGRPQDYVSRVLSGKPPAQGGKNLGEDLAREIEEKLKLPAGWFDRDDGAAREPPARYVVDSPHDYPALIARRISEADEAVQLAVLNMIEAFLADGDENGATRRRRRAAHRKG